MNMLFGNSSIHEDVTLEDVEFPARCWSRSVAPARASLG